MGTQSGIFEAGYYSIKNRGVWLLWIGIFAGLFFLFKEPFIPPTTSSVTVRNATSQSFGDPYHADLIRVD